MFWRPINFLTVGIENHSKPLPFSLLLAFDFSFINFKALPKFKVLVFVFCSLLVVAWQFTFYLPGIQIRFCPFCV